MTPAPKHQPQPINPFLPVLLAWIVPGLGHWLIGEKKRGLIVGATILALFTIGLLIGGVGVIDRRNEVLWYSGQVIVGPIAIAVDQYHAAHDTLRSGPWHQGHTHWDGPDPAGPGEPPPAYSTSVGRMNELGTLYTTLAGVLNLLAILDLIGREQFGPGAARQKPLPDVPPGATGKIVTRET